MRIFSSARIAVIDADPDHRTALCSALTDLGMANILPAATVDEATQLDRQASLDLCVVNALSVVNGHNGGTRFPVNPFDPARTPAILIASDTSRETVRAAAAHGYRVVLPSPASPRIVYRRMGSILQKVRRAQRVNSPELQPLAPARAAELQQS